MIATPLAIICEKTLLLQNILDDCKKVNFRYILNKSVEGYLRNYAMVGPHLSPWENCGACPLGINFQHVKDKTIIKKSQQGFTKSKSCWTNLAAHYDKMTGHADEGRKVNAMEFYFS